ncbi:MAG: T9SS type A sorting domain-containing protein [Algibacter sp.]
MKQYKLLILFFIISVFHSYSQQQSCEIMLEAAEKVLRKPSPFDDINTLFSLVEPCALQGNAKAENFLGTLYLKGIGIKKDEKKAFAYISKSANQGYASAQYNMGRFYKYGTGCEIDFKKAIEWFERGSNNGSSKSAYSLGYMYYKGFGVKQDYENAVYWFKNSSDPMARHYLGLCYYFGYGLAANEEKALEILSSNSILNSKTFISYIEKSQKEKLEAEVVKSLESTAEEGVMIDSSVVVDVQNELEYVPYETLELEDVKGKWIGKIVEYDWSGQHILRVLPVEMDINVDDDTQSVVVNSIVDDKKINSTAVWQDETLYFNNTNEKLKVDRLYSGHPKQLTVNYSLLSVSLQKYKDQGAGYIIGSLDSYIPSWSEYGRPMSIVLKPEGSTGIDDETLLALAEQDQFIKLYPVPFNQNFTVQYQLEKAENVYIELISLNGINKIVILPTTEQQQGDYTYSVPAASSLPEGLYVVRIMAGGQLYTRMIIKDN